MGKSVPKVAFWRLRDTDRCEIVPGWKIGPFFIREVQHPNIGLGKTDKNHLNILGKADK